MLAFGLAVTLAFGLSLIALEIFVIPGFGFVGVLGGAFTLAACYFAGTMLTGIESAAAIVGGLVAGGFAFWAAPRSRLGKSMVLETAHVGDAGDETLKLLVEQTGTAHTDLRPSGTAKIANRVVDVVTDGQYVEAGTEVRVIEVRGARVVVQATSEEEQPPAGHSAPHSA